MKRWLALPVAVVATATPALAQRVEISPYVEAGQVLLADLKDGDVVELEITGLGRGKQTFVQATR